MAKNAIDLNVPSKVTEWQAKLAKESKRDKNATNAKETEKLINVLFFSGENNEGGNN